MHAEILVIGAGTGGLRAAMTAASNGAKTVLVGDGPIAGTCLNNGCIPTKTMLHAADVMRTINEAKEAGIIASGKPDFKKIMQRVRAISKEGRDHATKAVENNKHLTYIEGRAKFVGEKCIEVNNKRITADHIIIATGSSTFVPPIPGINDVPYITNVEAVELTKAPKHIIILGGGYIACEYATFFASLGIKTTIVERAPTILGILDEDLRAYIEESLQHLGVKVYTGAATTNVSYKKKIFSLNIAAKRSQTISGDVLLVATGRKPNTAGLDLEKTGVKLTDRGHIKTTNTCRTSHKDIFAIGDVNGQSQFAHTAKREGWVVLEQILLGERARMHYDDIGWAVFTHPVVAGVGKSEFQLKQEATPYEVLRADFHSCGKARVICEDKGHVKILHNDGEILGAFIAGPQADNLLHELVIAKQLGKKALETLRNAVHVHPTLAEVMENLS